MTTEQWASPETTDEARGFTWKAIREGLRGSDQDFTIGSLRGAILILAVPMVLEMAGESVFAVCDAFFVSRLGSEPLATVGLCESVLAIVYALAMGLSMATTALVARRFGEKNYHGAARAAVQAILLGIGLSVVLGILGGFSGGKILRLMGASEEVVAIGSGYTRTMLGGVATVFLLFLNNAVLRGAGDASMAMRSLWLANAINLVLDPCLIFGLGPFPELGLVGAAIATNIGRGTGVCYQFFVLLGRSGRLRVSVPDIALDFEVMKRLVRVSAGGVAQMLIGTASWIGLVRILAVFGSTVLAGYVVAIRIVIFAILPAFGLSNAAATLVGQNLGAGKPERAERSVWLTGALNMLFLGTLAVVFWTLAPQLIRLFTDDPDVQRPAEACLRIISYGYPFYAWGMVTVQAFNGAGDTFTPTIVNFFCFWVFQIPLAYLAAHSMHMGAAGVFWAIAIAYSLSAVVGLLLFRSGRWKSKVV